MGLLSRLIGRASKKGGATRGAELLQPANMPPTPLRVYHGTRAAEDFAVPTLAKTRRGQGISVAEDPRMAMEYGGLREEGSRILPLELRGHIATPRDYTDAMNDVGFNYDEIPKMLRARGFTAYRLDEGGHPYVIDETALVNFLTKERGGLLSRGQRA